MALSLVIWALRLVYPEKDLFFRNLDGSGDLLKQVDLRGKTIVNKSVLVKHYHGWRYDSSKFHF